MASLGLELNEKTQIFPLRNGLDFLGFHTYLTDSGKVIRKLRHSSVKKMRAKLRRWEKDYPAGLVTRDPAEEWPAWSHPVGAHDAYSIGAQVTHNEKHWTSNVDGNVWEPGVYGWDEAVE